MSFSSSTSSQHTLQNHGPPPTSSSPAAFLSASSSYSSSSSSPSSSTNPASPPVLSPLPHHILRSRPTAGLAPTAELAAAVAPDALAFSKGLPRPETYGNPPRRDVIGWTARLLDPKHIRRWLRLCAALRRNHPVGIHLPAADAQQKAITAAIIEHIVLPLQNGETRRVLTTNQRRHVKRTLESGLTFMLVFDLHLALFDLAECIHRSAVAAHLHNEDHHPLATTDDMALDLTAQAPPTTSSATTAPHPQQQDPSLVDVLTANFLFNVAVQKCHVVARAVETNGNVRDLIERTTADLAWAKTYAMECGLQNGQERVIHLVLSKGAAREEDDAIQRSHLSVFVENDPLVFAANLSTLDPDRAILLADKHVGLQVSPTAISIASHGVRFVPSPGRSASNLRKLLYVDALLERFKNGTLNKEGYVLLAQKFVMLNSGHAAPGSTWADPWPNWPVLDPSEKEVLEAGATRGNIVAAALLAALILANHMVGIGTCSSMEFVGAVEQLKQITELGDVAAPSYLGHFLSEPGTMQNIPEAIRFCRIAVQRGHKNAPAFLGKLLLQHDGDAVEAVELFKLSIARGGRHAHKPLADLLSGGAPGVSQNLEEAKCLYEEAARLGDPEAGRIMCSSSWVSPASP